MSRIEERVILKIRERSEKGIEEHGATMERNDLSIEEWLIHLQDELMDGAIYIEKLLDELGEVGVALDLLRGLAQFNKQIAGDE